MVFAEKVNLIFYDAKICPHCGEEIVGKGKFCANCGATL
ncbi:zinc-ribbon domain-containing protein [Anaerovibrio sp.]